MTTMTPEATGSPGVPEAAARQIILVPPRGARRSAWMVLREPGFRLYFLATLTSNLGTWFQSTVQILIAFQITHSVFIVGLITSAQFAGIVFSPWAASWPTESARRPSCQHPVRVCPHRTVDGLELSQRKARSTHPGFWCSWSRPGLRSGPPRADGPGSRPRGPGGHHGRRQDELGFLQRRPGPGPRPLRTGDQLSQAGPDFRAQRSLIHCFRRCLASVLGRRKHPGRKKAARGYRGDRPDLQFGAHA